MVDSWQDKSFGESGYGVWFPVFIIVSIVAILIWSTYLYTVSHRQEFYFLGPFFLVLIAGDGFYIMQAINILQEIAIIDDKGLAGKCFFGRVFDCDVADIKSMTYYHITWKIRTINYLDPKIPGINIVLKNGDLFRINSRIEDFPSLVEALKTLAAEAKHIECNL